MRFSTRSAQRRHLKGGAVNLQTALCRDAFGIGSQQRITLLAQCENDLDSGGHVNRTLGEPRRFIRCSVPARGVFQAAS